MRRWNIVANSRDDIIIRLLSDIDDKYDKTVGSFFYDTQKPVAIESEALYERIEEISSKAFVATATGADLDAKLAEVGKTRIAATYATGNVTFSGTPQTIISSGTQVKSDVLIFTVESSGTISESGTVTLPAVCNVSGTTGNVPIGAINSLVVSINGITSVTNTEAFTGGYEEETDAEARSRYLSSAKKPATSGNKYHYEEWAKEASSGVGEVKCIPLWDNDNSHTPGSVAGSVTVLVLDKESNPAQQDLIETVKTHIENERPVGASVIVASAVALTINVNATLTLQSGYISSTVKSAIETSISQYLKNIAFAQDEVSAAHIGSCILSVDGVLDYENLTVNGGTSNIDIANNEVPTMGVLTIG